MSAVGFVVGLVRRNRPLTLLLAALLLSGCSGALRAKFPTEEEVRSKLRKGMTAEQVLATFGEPPGHAWVDVQLGGKVHYIAPVRARTRPGAGYAGFTVYFDAGKVWDWEVITLNPSYEHRFLPEGRNSWQVRLVTFLVVTGGLYAIIHALRTSRGRRKELLDAYASRHIARDLPPDLRFITREATLQMVLHELGPSSRTRKLRVSDAIPEEEIVAYEYDLPSNGAVAIMPEPPAEPESRIRAVVYRHPPEIL